MSAVWPTIRLGEILKERLETPAPDDLALGSVRIVSKIKFDTGQIELRTGSETNTGMILVRPGDLLVSGINAVKGAIAIYDTNETDPIAATIHYGAYEINRQRADIHFLWWMLRSQYFKELLLENVPGGIKTELKAKRLLPIPIPLPPLPQQSQMVARIEGLADRIKEARNLRQQATAEIEVLRSSFTSTLCLASDSRLIAVGDLVGHDSLRNGKSVKSAGNIGDVRCLTLSAMRNGLIDLDDNKVVPMSREEAGPFLVRNGDVFVVRGNGSKSLCGMAGRVADKKDGVIFPDLFIRIPLPAQYILPEFFVAVWNSSMIREIIEEKAKTTSGIWKINQGHILSTFIPVPSIADQRRIVEALSELQGDIGSLKSLQAETAGELDALLPSILDHAFRGEL
jgi:type I restriction enzyme S subunit